MEEKNTKNQAVLLASVLALLASVVIVITYIVPQFFSLKNLSNDISSKQSELDQGKNRVSALKSAAAIVKAAHSELETLGIALPASQDSDKAIAQVADAAGRAGLSVGSINSNSVQQGELTLIITGSGSYGNIADFVSNIERNLRPTKVTELSLASNGTNVDATISLSMPFLSQGNDSTEQNQEQTNE